MRNPVVVFVVVVADVVLLVEGRLALGSTCVGDGGCEPDWVVGGGDSTGLCRLANGTTKSLVVVVVVLGRFSLEVGEKGLGPVLGPGGGGSTARVVNDSSGSSGTAVAVKAVWDALSLRVVATGPLVVTNDKEEED